VKIILTADVPNLGAPGDLVQVKDGYARNYLLPRNLAIVATSGAEKQVATIRRARQARQIRDLGHAQEVAGTLSSLGTVSVTAKAARSGGKLFGSVTGWSRTGQAGCRPRRTDQVRR
jgi:large subunit ribosomal protein L9